jgi:hypothetical protein
MERIPAKIIMDHGATVRLFEALKVSLGKSKMMGLLSEIIDFIEHSKVFLHLPNEIHASEVDQNYFLRTILSRAYSGADSCRVFSNFQMNPTILGAIQLSDLIKIKMLESSIGSDGFEDWLEIKRLPDGWEAFTNNRVPSITVGGSKSIFKSWRDLKLAEFPVSSIIIIDPYLLKEKAEIEVNLPRIIDGLVDSSRTGNPVHILLVVGDNVNKRLEFEQYVDRNSKLLASLIPEKYGNRKIKISVAYVKGEFLHDRFIFTNYYFMEAGRGFNLYSEREAIDKKKPNKVTIRFLSSSLAYREFVTLIGSYCDVLFNRNAIKRLDGNIESNEILRLIRGTL